MNAELAHRGNTNCADDLVVESEMHVTVGEAFEISKGLARFRMETSGVSILPRNFCLVESPDEFLFEQQTSTVQKLGRQVGLEIEVLGPRDYTVIREKDASFVVPILLLTHAFLVEAGAAVSVKLLEHLGAHFMSHRATGTAREEPLRLEILVARGQDVKSLRYTGPPQELSNIITVARSLFKEEIGDNR